MKRTVNLLCEVTAKWHSVGATVGKSYVLYRMSKIVFNSCNLSFLIRVINKDFQSRLLKR